MFPLKVGIIILLYKIEGLFFYLIYRLYNLINLIINNNKKLRNVNKARCWDMPTVKWPRLTILTNFIWVPLITGHWSILYFIMFVITFSPLNPGRHWHSPVMWWQVALLKQSHGCSQFSPHKFAGHRLPQTSPYTNN